MVNGLFTVVMELFEPLKESKLCSHITTTAKQHCFIKNLYYFFTCSFSPLLPHPHQTKSYQCNKKVYNLHFNLRKIVKINILLLFFKFKEQRKHSVLFTPKILGFLENHEMIYM